METIVNHETVERLHQPLPPNVFKSTCPSRNVVELLSDKWVTLLLWALESAPLRFGELRRRLDGVTQKMLTQTLRKLERNGLVSRTVYPTTPPSVEYALTPLGVSVAGISEQLCRWAQQHFVEVIAARDGYDRAALPPEGVSIVSAGKRRS